MANDHFALAVQQLHRRSSGAVVDPCRLVREIKETVPSEKFLGSLSEGERPHVCHPSFSIREGFAAWSDRRRRGGDAPRVNAVVDKMACDRLTLSAVDGWNARVWRQQRNKAIPPTALDAEIAAASGVSLLSSLWNSADP